MIYGSADQQSILTKYSHQDCNKKHAMNCIWKKEMQHVLHRVHLLLQRVHLKPQPVHFNGTDTKK
jgi:hypothetical protein